MTIRGRSGNLIGRLFIWCHVPIAVVLCTGNDLLKSLESYENITGLSDLRQKMDLVALTQEKFQSMKRVTVYKCNVNEAVAMLLGGKGSTSKNGPGCGTFSPELMVHSAESLASRSVVNLSNEASKMAIHFSYHYPK